MTNFLEYKIDKFIFRIADDRYYTDDGLWVKPDKDYLRIGLSDYLQQRSGDVAFAEIKAKGIRVAAGEELGVIETIKVNISLVSPFEGKVIEVNQGVEKSPETINQDPYGNGWVVVIEPDDGENSLRHLLNPQTYLAKIKNEAEQELDYE
jgi:glycine cleavage system H protein